MWYRLAIPLLIPPFLLFMEMAGWYKSIEAMLFTLYVLLSLMCMVMASGMWWLGSAEEPVNEHK